MARVKVESFNIPVWAMDLSLLSGLGSVLLAWATYAGRGSLPLAVQLVVWHTIVSAVVVALASYPLLAGCTKGLCGKKEDGTIRWPYKLLLFPYHMAVQAIMRGYRLLASEPVVSRIEDGWYLGGCPTREANLPAGISPALLDVTCEMPRYVAAPAYKLLPTWETHGTSAELMQEGVVWALQQREAGHPVLAYCTQGHCRSAAVMCALLIADGRAAGPAEALRVVVRARPGVKPNLRQAAALERWYERYGRKLT